MVQTGERTLRTQRGAYRVFDLVAAGAFGSVSYGRDLADNSPVAIKQLHPHHARDPRVVEQFEREAPLIRQLAHPHIVRVLDQGRDESGLPFIVLEWVTGWTLEALIHRRGALPPGEVAEIGCQVLDGLEAARLRGVIHRDIKPLNLMLTAQGRVKIMDFGIAKEADLAVATGTGGVIGTPAYMAPEQFRGEPPDTRTDLYALGISLYQLAAGITPFQADTLAGYMYHHLQTPPPPLDSLKPGIDPDLAAAIERSLAKQSVDRYATPAEMHAALRPFAAGQLAAPAGLPPDDWSETRTLTVPTATDQPPPAQPTPLGQVTPRPQPTPLGQRTPSAQPTPLPGQPTPPPGPTTQRPVGGGSAPWKWALIGATAAVLLLGGYLALRPFDRPGTVTEPPPTVVAAANPAGQPTAQPTAGGANAGDAAAACRQGVAEAEQLLRRRAFDEAIARLEALRSPQCDVAVPLYGAHVDHAAALAQDERTGEAIEAFDRALRVKPGGAEATAGRETAVAYRGGREAIERKAWPTAVEQLSKVYRADPGYARGNVVGHLTNAHLGQGDEHATARRPCEALAAYQQAAALRPADSGVSGRIAGAERECALARAQSTTAPPTAAPPTAAPPPTTAPPTAGPPAFATPPTQPSRPDPTQFVRSYYQAIDQRRYRDAYAYLSRAAQARLSYPDFERQFSQTLISISVRRIDTVEIGSTSGSLAAHTTTVSAAGARQVTECWRVDWRLVLEDGQWRRDAISQVAEGC